MEDWEQLQSLNAHWWIRLGRWLSIVPREIVEFRQLDPLDWKRWSDAVERSARLKTLFYPTVHDEPVEK